MSSLPQPGSTVFPQGSRLDFMAHRTGRNAIPDHGVVEGVPLRDMNQRAVMVPVRMADSALVWVGVSNIIIDDTQEMAA